MLRNLTHSLSLCLGKLPPIINPCSCTCLPGDKKTSLNQLYIFGEYTFYIFQCRPASLAEIQGNQNTILTDDHEVFVLHNVANATADVYFSMDEYDEETGQLNGKVVV